MKKILYLTVLACAIFVPGCEKKASGAGNAPSGAYTWLAGGVGGGWHTVAGEFARFLGEKEPGISINIVPGGGVGNPVSLDRGEGDIAWGVGYVNRAAYYGTVPLFHEKYTNIASVAGTLSVDYYHFLAGKDQGITTIEQLAMAIKNGEKIRLAAAASGTTDYVMASIILDFFDTSFDMIDQNGGSVSQVVYSEMIKMFIDGRVDYAIVNMGMPGAVVTEMAEGRPSVMLAASNEVIDYCHYTWGTVSRSSGLTRIPGGTYPGIESDIPAVCHSTEIIVSPKLSEAFVYTFTKALNENKDILVQFGANYAVFDPKGTAATSVQVPLHPGAVRYYREVGVLE